MDLSQATPPVHQTRTATTVDHRVTDRSRIGVLYAIASYGFWGLIPLYFKLVQDVSPLEVLAHRVLWSCVLLTGVASILRRWTDVRRALRARKTLLLLGISTALLALNWFTYIYAVSSNQVVEASL